MKIDYCPSCKDCVNNKIFVHTTMKRTEENNNDGDDVAAQNLLFDQKGICFCPSPNINKDYNEIT